MRVLRYGERALMVEVGDHHHALSLYENLRREPIDGVVDLVPAARTLLITFVDERSAKSATSIVAARTVAPRQQSVGPLVTIPVVYDGADLDAIAELTNLSVEQVISAHQGCRYVVAFLGFAPGFAYLTGLDAALRVPRRSAPRTYVPSGSVAIAGEFGAVYPRALPGGWQLVGHTNLPMWDLGRQPPATLQPGTRVRFTRALP
jgi:KipI family sensor histidine kinase inhibitor